MKLEALVDRVTPDEPDRDRVRRTVLDAIAAMGFHVAGNGEVCDPRPAPSWERRPVRQGDCERRRRR